MAYSTTISALFQLTVRTIVRLSSNYSWITFACSEHPFSIRSWCSPAKISNAAKSLSYPLAFGEGNWENGVWKPAKTTAVVAICSVDFTQIIKVGHHISVTIKCPVKLDGIVWPAESNKCYFRVPADMQATFCRCLAECNWYSTSRSSWLLQCCMALFAEQAVSILSCWRAISCLHVRITKENLFFSVTEDKITGLEYRLVQEAVCLNSHPKWNKDSKMLPVFCTVSMKRNANLFQQISAVHTDCYDRGIGHQRNQDSRWVTQRSWEALQEVLGFPKSQGRPQPQSLRPWWSMLASCLQVGREQLDYLATWHNLVPIPYQYRSQSPAIWTWQFVIINMAWAENVLGSCIWLSQFKMLAYPEIDIITHSSVPPEL